jgi:hypothetical protein
MHTFLARENEQDVTHDVEHKQVRKGIENKEEGEDDGAQWTRAP